MWQRCTKFETWQATQRRSISILFAFLWTQILRHFYPCSTMATGSSASSTDDMDTTPTIIGDNSHTYPATCNVERIIRVLQRHHEQQFQDMIASLSTVLGSGSYQLYFCEQRWYLRSRNMLADIVWHRLEYSPAGNMNWVQCSGETLGLEIMRALHQLSVW